jgi:hypothetical protein
MDTENKHEQEQPKKKKRKRIKREAKPVFCWNSDLDKASNENLKK